MTEYYNTRAFIYINKGQYDLTIADYNKAIQLSQDPDLVSAARSLIQELSK